MTRMTEVKRAFGPANYLITLGLGLSLSLGALPLLAQQNQRGDDQSNVEQQQEPQEQAPQGQPGNDRGTMENQQGAQNQAPPNQEVPPRTLTLPAGTVIHVRADNWLSTDRNVIGDEFSATLDQPIVVDGWVIARRGQSETGRVSLVKKAHGSETSQLGLQLNVLTLVDGQQLPVQTQLSQAAGYTPGSRGQDAAIVGTTTGVGAVIGAVADGGAGAAIGAGAGAIAGLIGVGTRGKPTVIPPETVLSFRLQTPVTISTERSESAFQPVTQEDYNSRPANGRPRQRFATSNGSGYPPPPPDYYGYPYSYAYPYAYGYPYGYYGYYPAPFSFGFYGGYGFGGRFGYGRRFRR